MGLTTQPPTRHGNYLALTTPARSKRGDRPLWLEWGSSFGEVAENMHGVPAPGNRQITCEEQWMSSHDEYTAADIYAVAAG